jgi:nucleolar protein 12
MKGGQSVTGKRREVRFTLNNDERINRPAMDESNSITKGRKVRRKDERAEAPITSKSPASDLADSGDLQDPEVLARTAFVGNVPVSVKRKDLKRLFKPFGDIESVRLRGVIADVPNLPKKTALLARRLHKNCDALLAYVVFKAATEESEVPSKPSEPSVEKDVQAMRTATPNHSEPTIAVKKACAGLNLTILQDKHIRVTPAAHTRGPLRQSVFLGNLPFDITEEELILLFQPIAVAAGCILVGVRVTRDKETGMGRGVGFASFDDELGVRTVINMGDELKIRDRVIRVERATKDKKRNSKTAKRNAKAEKRREQNSERALISGKREKKKRREQHGSLGVTRKIRKQLSDRRVSVKVKHAARKARQAEAAAAGKS